MPKARRQAFATRAPPKQQRKTNARKLVKRNIFGKSLRFKAHRRAFAKHPGAKPRSRPATGSARGAGQKAPLAKGDGPGRPKQAQGRRPSLARESARGACPETPFAKADDLKDAWCENEAPSANVKEALCESEAPGANLKEALRENEAPNANLKEALCENEAPGANLKEASLENEAPNAI